MAKDNNGGMGFPGGTCPDSDHIASERARLRQASVKHFAQTASGKAQTAPPKQAQATGAKGPVAAGPTDLEDEM
jgi:hypothetical protein